VPALQHFYTSFLNPKTGEGGFRTKAMSPELWPEALSGVLRLIGYRIPSTLDERAPDTHPVALRMSPLDATHCVLSCIRSCGADENGRPGNLFAHSLILPTQDLPEAHPAWLWEHANWKSNDPTSTDTLSALPTLDWSAALEASTVWSFIEEKTRLAVFARLLSALVSCEGPAGRRLVIVDTPHHVALWVAALSSVLPVSLRRLFTFATYYHDPYSSVWLVTGTTNDSTMRLAAQDFLQYFIVDADTGRTSEQQPGPYADLVMKHVGTSGPDEELAAFLSFCERRVRHAPRFDGALDHAAVAHSLLGRADWAKATEFELRIAGDLVDEIASKAADPEQLADLVFALSVVRTALTASRNNKLFESYRRAASVARRGDPAFENYLDDELALIGTMAMVPDSESRVLLRDVVDAYGDKAVQGALLTPACLDSLNSLVDGPPRLLGLWSCFGRLLCPPHGSHALLESTLESIDVTALKDAHAIHRDADALINGLLGAAKGIETSLLATALKRRKEHGGASAELLYYGLVRELPLEQRRPWRELVEKDIDDISEYEIQCDVRRSGAAAFAVLTQWATHLGSSHSRRGILSAGVRRAWTDMPAGSQQDLARHVIGHDDLMRALEPEWEHTLVRAAFSDRSFEWVIGESLDLVRNYAGHRALHARDAALLEMRMAIEGRRFDGRKSAQIQERLAGLSGGSQYAQEVGRLLPPFMSPAAPLADYGALINAAYVPKHGAAFWHIHRAILVKLCADLPSAPKFRLPFVGSTAADVDRASEDFAKWFASLLGFWFTDATGTFLEQPYLSQQFFMELPGTLSALQRCPQWSQVAQAVVSHSNREPWFLPIQHWVANSQAR
jgi:hypothetical protein